MADIPVISGNFPDGTPFAFSLNGAATQRQMERLIALTSILAKRVTNPKKDPEQLAQIEALRTNTTEVNKSTKATKASTTETLNFQDALLNLSTVSNIARGNLASAFNGISSKSAAVAVAMGGMVGQLFDYSGQLGQAMQRGVAGGVMDFAIAAKTGGLTLGQFSKALDESGGSFAMLGNGATDGAKQFGSLVSEVRYATAEVGNLGLSNEQLATFTAQQVKVAVAQGFKGRSANAQVIENTKAFSEELDNLANRTGKSVLELVSAAQKLALDPIVSNFVATARSGKAELSKAMQSYAASLEGLFGKAGEQIRTDALQNALAGLPLSMTEAGMNLQRASASVYGELQHQANRAAAGSKITEEDTQRLHGIVLREVDARRQELTFMAAIKGSAGDAARQLFALAAEARGYNTAEGAKRRKEDEAAKAFVASTNQLRANFQQLAIPLLEFINGVNWALMINVLRGFTTVAEVMLTPFSKLGEILSGTGLGSVVGGLLGIVTVATIVSAGFSLLTKSLTTLTASVLGSSAAINASTAGSLAAGAGGGTGGAGGKKAGGIGNFLLNNKLVAAGLGTNMLGGALSMAGESKLAENSESTWGKIVSAGGTILEWSGLLLAGLPALSSFVRALPGVWGAIKSYSSLLVKILPGIKEVLLGFITPLITKVSFALTSFQLGLSMVTAFLSKQFMKALLAFKTALVSGKAGDALGGLGGPGGRGRAGMMKGLKIGAPLALALGGYQMYDTEQQRKSGEISDKQATVENSATVGGMAGGIAGGALGTFVGGPIGMAVGSALGSVLGTGLGHVVGDLFTSDGTSSVNKELTDTQTSAIDNNNMRESENTKQLAQLNKNMETLVASTDANLMVNGKIASISDNNSRYLRGATFGSA